MTQRQILDYSLKKLGAFVCFSFGPDVTVFKVKSPSFEQTRIFVQLSVRQGVKYATFSYGRMAGEFYRNIYPDSVTRG